jgi:hypothetical protein
MIEDPTVLYVPALVGGAIFMLIGAFFGMAASKMSSPKKEQPRGTGKIPKVERPGMTEIMRVWRELQSGKLFIEMDGQIYRTRGDLLQAQNDFLLKEVNELNEWLGLRASMPSIPDIQMPDESATLLPVVPSPTPRPASPIPPTSAIPLKKTDAEKYGVTPPSLNVVDVVSQAVGLTQVKKASAPVPTSIAGQIDAILQEKLLTSPLHDRGIRLVELPDQGVQVHIGLERFESVAEVTDPEVKALLQECVAEWEKKHYPT